MTIHPDVSGRPHVLLMHQRFVPRDNIDIIRTNDLPRLIDYINKHEGVEWVTFEQMSDYFKSKNKPEAGAVMPATQSEVQETLKKHKSK
jgi:hypothetical protein